MSEGYAITKGFQSTLPVRGATPPLVLSGDIEANFNPRSRAGSDRSVEAVTVPDIMISIHAPRAGSDTR